jgi:hypothetical protein
MRANTLERSTNLMMNPNLPGTIRSQFEIVRDFVCGKTPARRLVHEVGAHMAASIGSPSFNDFFSSFTLR